MITADHGADQSKRKPLSIEGMSLPAERPFPALMVKVCAAKGEMSYCSTPTCHSKIKEFVISELKEYQTREEADEILRADNRKFRDFESAKSRHLDFAFNGEGKLKSVGVVNE